MRNEDMVNEDMRNDNMKKQQRRHGIFKNWIKERALHREEGLDGILVTVGLCIIALLLCVVMKDTLADFITTIVTAMKTKANSILMGG